MTFSLRAATASAGVALLSTLVPATIATANVPDKTFEFPAGIACAFPLRIDAFGLQPVNKTFDAIPNGVRFLAAGKGSDLVLTNESTGKTLTLKGNGSVQWTRIDANGTARITTTGHNVNIYFPTDVPAGPSTTLIVGREDIAVDLATGTFTRLSRTGVTTDLCAALS